MPKTKWDRFWVELKVTAKIKLSKIRQLTRNASKWWIFAISTRAERLKKDSMKSSSGNNFTSETLLLRQISWHQERRAGLRQVRKIGRPCLQGLKGHQAQFKRRKKSQKKRATSYSILNGNCFEASQWSCLLLWARWCSHLSPWHRQI